MLGYFEIKRKIIGVRYNSSREIGHLQHSCTLLQHGDTADYLLHKCTVFEVFLYFLVLQQIIPFLQPVCTLHRNYALTFASSNYLVLV
jgi:hypothetical protein